MRLLPAIATLVVLSVSDAKVSELTMEDFSETIESEKLSLVMFYAPCMRRFHRPNAVS